MTEQKTHYGIVLTTKYPLPEMIRRLRRLLETVSQEELINQLRWLSTGTSENV